MLAIIKATEAWRHYLEATPYAFEIHTDHNNLLYFTKSQNLSKRQARWQQWMMRFSYQLIYKKGSQMHVADLLSRRSDHYMSSGDDNKDQVLLNPVTIKSIDVTDCTYEERQSLIMDFHDTPVARHKGVKAIYNGLRKHYIWNGMKEQIQIYVKHCQKCQQSKVSNQKTSRLLLLLPTPSSPWQDVTMDFTEMLEFLSYNYILVVVDWFPKEVVFVLCTKEETAYSTAELFRDLSESVPPTKAEESGRAYAGLGTRQEGGRFEDIGLSVCASPLRILVLGFRRTEFQQSAVGPKVSRGVRETEEMEEFTGTIQCDIRTEELPPQHAQYLYYTVEM